MYQPTRRLISKPNVCEAQTVAVLDPGESLGKAFRKHLSVHRKGEAAHLLEQEKERVQDFSADQHGHGVMANRLTNQLPDVMTPRRHPGSPVFVFHECHTAVTHHDKIRRRLDRHTAEHETNVGRALRRTDDRHQPTSRQCFAGSVIDRELQRPPTIFVHSPEQSLVKTDHLSAARSIVGILRVEVRWSVEVRKSQSCRMRWLWLDQDFPAPNPGLERLAKMDRTRPHVRRSGLTDLALQLTDRRVPNTLENVRQPVEPKLYPVGTRHAPGLSSSSTSLPGVGILLYISNRHLAVRAAAPFAPLKALFPQTDSAARCGPARLKLTRGYNSLIAYHWPSRKLAWWQVVSRLVPAWFLA